MILLPTHHGYINAVHVRRLYVKDKKIFVEIFSKNIAGWIECPLLERIDKEYSFENNKEAADCLDKLIEELKE